MRTAAFGTFRDFVAPQSDNESETMHISREITPVATRVTLVHSG
jgi:hypothetical protein